jgi:hypothetical protein
MSKVYKELNEKRKKDIGNTGNTTPVNGNNYNNF